MRVYSPSRPMKDRIEEREVFRVGALARAALLVVCALVVAAGCGSGSGATGRRPATSGRTSTTADLSAKRKAEGKTARGHRSDRNAARQNKARTDPRARIAAARTCRRFGQPALHRMLVRARRAQARRPLNVRRSLMLQARALPAAAQRGPAGARMAAALYAVERPVNGRRAAFAGCVAGLGSRHRLS